MDLKSLRDTIAATSPEDWNRITGWGANTAPIPPTLLETISEGEYGAVQRFHIRSHSELIVLRSDIDISVAWGMNMDPASDATGRQPFSPDWADRFGCKLHYDFADVRYRGQLVDRYDIITVDDGEWSILPAATMDLLHDEKDELPEIYRVSRFHRDLARLLHLIVYGRPSAFERAMNVAETVVDE